jgi:hypothetical protein
VGPVGGWENAVIVCWCWVVERGVLHACADNAGENAIQISKKNGHAAASAVLSKALAGFRHFGGLTQAPAPH